MTNSNELVNPDMPSEQIKLHMGEMSVAEVRSVRAAIRWANSKSANRIEELEAELAFYKGFHDGVCKNGTHVIVPVQMTDAMYDVGRNGLAQDASLTDIWHEIVKAAQEQPK